MWDRNILIRRAMANTLSPDPEFEILVSTSRDRIEVLMERESPDVIILDIDEAALDDFSMFNTLRERYPSVPVIVTAARTKRGAADALYTLQNGAFDVITKPEQDNMILFSGRHFSKRLPPAVKAATGCSSAINKTDIRTEKKEKAGQRKLIRQIVIGGGSGGSQALFSIFRKLPADLPVPIVVVQRLPRLFTQQLAQSLDRISDIQVQEAYDGAELLPGTAWIAKGGFQCEVQQTGVKQVLNLHRGPRVNGVRPSVDLLFRSAARLYGDEVLGIVLSGSGTDGEFGAGVIKEAGGTVIVQDPSQALSPELPENILRSGIAGDSYTAEQLGREITERAVRTAGAPATGTLAHFSMNPTF